MKIKKLVTNPFVLSGIILVLLMVGGVLSLTARQKSEEDLALLWKAEQQYEQLNNLALANSSGELEELLVSLQKSGSTYVKSRALFMQAMLAYRQENYREATERFFTLSQKFKNSYLAPVATLNAAYGFEQLEDLTKAKQLFEQASKDEKSLVWAEATFNLARLNEEQMDVASNFYHKLIAKLDEANLWRKAAENRLIALNIA